MKPDPTNVRCNVSAVLSDLCFEMFRCHSHGEGVNAETVLRWHKSLVAAAVANDKLTVQCEEIVEQGATAERLEALQKALAHANGQDIYAPRTDRW